MPWIRDASRPDLMAGFLCIHVLSRSISQPGSRYMESRRGAGRGSSGRRVGALGEAGLSSETFIMHEPATTLKHYLKVSAPRSAEHPCL